MELVATWKDDYGLNRCLEMVGLSKSSWYYHQARSSEPVLTSSDQHLKRLLLEIIQDHPGYGWRKLTPEVRHRTGQAINHKRIRRILNVADLYLYRTVVRAAPSGVDRILKSHTGDLNRLSGRTFGRFALLSADFTQVVYHQGTRRAWVVGFYDPVTCLPCGWAVGKSANTDQALEGWQQVRRTFAQWDHSLEEVTLHTDQDSVFTSYRWLHRVLCQDRVEVSFSERGAKDNPWIESLWSRLKAEAGQLLFDCDDLNELRRQVNEYFHAYIHTRRHQSLDQQIPVQLLKQHQTNGDHTSQHHRQLVL